GNNGVARPWPPNRSQRAPAIYTRWIGRMTVVAKMHAFQGRIATDHPFDFRGLRENGCVISNAQAHLGTGRSTRPGPPSRDALSEASNQLIFHVLNFLRPIFRAQS